MPEGMFLKSEGFASNLDDPDRRLTLERFCSETGRPYEHKGLPIPLETFVAYGRWFQERGVPSLEDVQVTNVRRDGSSFSLDLDSGETVEAGSVVVGVGVPRFAHIPSELRLAGSDRVLHSSEVSSLDGFAGQRIAIVGAGQSALELAALLYEHDARPTVIVRKAQAVWNPPSENTERPLLRRMRAPTTPLGHGWKLWVCSDLMQAVRLLPEDTRTRVAWQVLPAAGAAWLHDRVVPRVPVLFGTRVVQVTDDGDELRIKLRNGTDENELRVDRLIAGTGYQVELDKLEFIAPEVRTAIDVVRGAPRLSARFESTVSGLYFVGLAAVHTFGPAMRFVCGSTFASRTVARRLGGAAGRRKRQSRPAFA
jgi:thioredoxin reductase